MTDSVSMAEKYIRDGAQLVIWHLTQSGEYDENYAKITSVKAQKDSAGNHRIMVHFDLVGKTYIGQVDCKYIDIEVFPDGVVDLSVENFRCTFDTTEDVEPKEVYR